MTDRFLSHVEAQIIAGELPRATDAEMRRASKVIRDFFIERTTGHAKALRMEHDANAVPEPWLDLGESGA